MKGEECEATFINGQLEEFEKRICLQDHTQARSYAEGANKESSAGRVAEGHETSNVMQR